MLQLHSTLHVYMIDSALFQGIPATNTATKQHIKLCQHQACTGKQINIPLLAYMHGAGLKVCLHRKVVSLSNSFLILNRLDNVCSYR